MPPSFADIVEEARLSARALLDYGDSFFNPTVRLGVTGLSRAGKTVFITALIHGLTRGGRFPVFEPFATGRIARARLEPQPVTRCRASITRTMSALIQATLAELDRRHPANSGS
jgi:predicted YcjX-like family ATPase